MAAMGLTAASASGAAPQGPQTMQVAGTGASIPATSPGAQLWVARYDNPGNGGALSVAASPNGKTVFVTGYVTAGALEDYATVAYNTATGAQLWAARYTDPGHSVDRAYSVVVSPNGKTVFVTGTSLNSPDEYYDTVAYNAATGAQLWAERYSSVDSYEAPAAAVSPNGSTVFVTGTGTGADGYVTLAYNAVTGHQQWVKLYAGPAGGNFGHSVAVSRDGTKVFVTGASLGTNDGYDYATVAYNAVTGAQLWVKRYNGPGSGEDRASSVAVSPSGGAVYVTGYSEISPTAGYYYTTIAYSAVTGAQLWLARYNGPGDFNVANSVAVSPNGATVYVTGYSYGCICGGEDYATVGYNAATGAQLWVKRYDGAGEGSQALAMAVSPATGTVFVTGYSLDPGSDYATVAYEG
jgi:outer membrane protein assembly factor BamB